MAAIKRFFGKDKEKKNKNTNSVSSIGPPFGIAHNIHVGYDTQAGTFVGMPPAWQEWLKSSNIR